MNTLLKGRIGEVAVHLNLISNYDFNLYFPDVDDRGVDLLVETSPSDFIKVQIKTVSAPNKNSSIEISVKDLDKQGDSRYDVLALYVVSLDKIAYIPYDKGRHSYTLALSPAKNNQREGRTWFYEYLMFPLK